VNTLEQLKTAYNSTFAIGGVSCSKDSFVVNHPPAGGFQIKFCGKSPALLVAAFQDQKQAFS
jgi:hypothetical protein